MGKRVKSYARENERRLGRERGFRSLFPFDSHRFLFLVKFSPALYYLNAWSRLVYVDLFAKYFVDFYTWNTDPCFYLYVQLLMVRRRLCFRLVHRRRFSFLNSWFVFYFFYSLDFFLQFEMRLCENFCTWNDSHTYCNLSVLSFFFHSTLSAS